MRETYLTLRKLSGVIRTRQLQWGEKETPVYLLPLYLALLLVFPLIVVILMLVRRWTWPPNWNPRLKKYIWIGGSVAMVVWLFALIGLSNLMNTQESYVPSTTPPPAQSIPLTSPDNSFVTMDDHSAWADYSSFRLSGTVTNTHSEWSISSVEIKLEMLDEHGATIGESSIPVSPSTISPHREGVYKRIVDVPPSCVKVSYNLYGIWVPPR